MKKLNHTLKVHISGTPSMIISKFGMKSLEAEDISMAKNC